MAVRRPSGREDFKIGIICALPLEYDAVSLIFDEFWDEDGDPYGRAAGDRNNYTTGRIGKYNVVLALLSHMGKTNATSAALGLCLSYSGLRFVFLVGICGGVPHVGAKEILLGDVVISKTIVQYDFGRQYPDGFLRKDTVGDNLSKPNKEIRNLLVMFETDRGIKLLHRRTASFLKELQAIAVQRKSRGNYNYPGTAEDKLFESNYTHGIPRTRRTSGRVCDESFNLSCEEVGCDESHLVRRERLEIKRQLELDNIDEAQEPAIYVGPIASGDTVMKSGEDRDRIAREEGVIAFEMEAAGVWEELPCCIVVKGVCDYADSHKNKKWQNFAAATASSVTKVLVERFIPEDKPLTPAMRDASERADASNMLQNSMGLRELIRLTILWLIVHMSQLARGLPPQIKHQDHVTVIDARNRPIHFFLDTIGSVELFTEVLKERFKDLGLGKIKRGEWYLEDHYTGKILDLTKPWESLIRPGQLLDMTMKFRRRNISSTQCPACRSKNFGDPETLVTCHRCPLTYRRIEEIQEIPVLEEGSQPQPTTAVPQVTPKGEHKAPAPLPRPRPLKPQNDDDDISHYSRVQIIDTSFQIQKAGESKIAAGIATLSVQDLDDLERLAAYLAAVCGLPEEDCLIALRECETQLLAIPSAGTIRPTVIDKNWPIESIGSRLRDHTRTFDSGVRARSASRRRLPAKGIRTEFEQSLANDVVIQRHLGNLATIINQYSLNYYGASAESISHELGRAIINRIVLGGDDATTMASRLSPRLAKYASIQTGDRRDEDLAQICEAGAVVRTLIANNASDWVFGSWDRVRFPSVLKNGHVVLEAQI